MKFTKEQAFESLKGILTNNGKKSLRMSEKSISNQLETLMPLIANEEMELDEFVDKVKQSFTVMNSNAEKDNSDFIKKWEKEHGQTPTPPNNNPNEGENEAVAKLLKRIEDLENKEIDRQKEISISKKRKDLIEAMKSKGIKDEQWAKDFVNEISVTEDMDIEAKADAFLKIYNKSKAHVNSDTTPLGSDGKPINDKNRFSYIQEMYNREEERKKNLI